MRVIFVSAAVVLLDQISKIFVKGFSIPFLHISSPGMYEGQTIPVIGNFFRITFTENPGLAFGFAPGHGFKLWISLFSLFASIGLLIYLYIIRNQKLSLRLSIAFILGGAIGNLIDRMFYGVIYGYAPLFYGKVVDFLDFDFFRITIFNRTYERWPIFNFADAAVTIGVFILIFFYRKQTEEKTELKTAGENIAVNSGEQLDEGTNQPGNDSAINPEIKGSGDDEDNKGKEIPF